MLVCLDATVLCGALRTPTGINFRLLELAADGVVLQGFTTDVAGVEFVRNALEGLGGVTYTIEEITEFLDAFEPLFDPENVAPSPIGRSLTDKTWLHGRPVGEVVFELNGRSHEELLEGLPQQLRVQVGELEPYDLHLVAAAADRGADAICSANRRHLPEGQLAGGIRVVRPGTLARELGR